MREQQAYDELIQRTREEALLASCSELLGWDELTYMPPAGGAHRGEQMALLNGHYHAKSTDPRIGELLAELEGSSLTRDPLAPAAVNIREIARSYRRAVRLPRALVEELARVTTRAQREWEIARQEADFRRFSPWLARIVSLKQYEAEAVGHDMDAYDALLEDYEPGARGDSLSDLFAALRRAYAVGLCPGERRTSTRWIDPSSGFSDRKATTFLRVDGSDWFRFHARKDRRDSTPFAADAGRLPARDGYNSDSLADGVRHFARGGAYVEQGLDVTHQGTPMASVPSLGMHESHAPLGNNIGRAAFGNISSAAPDGFSAGVSRRATR